MNFAVPNSTNPYKAPHAVATDKSNPPTKAGRPLAYRLLFALPAITLAGAETCHYFLCVYAWSLIVFICIKNDFTVWQFTWTLFGAFPAMLLLPVTLVALYRGVRLKRYAFTLGIVVLVLNSLLFWYDVRNKRCQIRTGVASAEYWQSGGSECFYCNWPWYNDNWHRQK